MKKFFQFKLFLFITVGIIAITIFNVLCGYLYLEGPSQKNKVIVIEKGLSTHAIAQKLAEENIIKYPILFEIIAVVYCHNSHFKTGEYQFTVGESPFQLLNQLKTGRSIIHKLFIPEGTTVNGIIEIIETNNRLQGQINENIPEGFLMPSTYHYSYGDRRDKMIDIMKTEMSSTIDAAMQLISPDSPLKTRKDVLILASIIEKEAGNDAERAIIAGVFINRLKKHMKLQADPTVIYAITLGKKKLKRSLVRQDLKIQSPYNTYHIYDLPLGPICCPSKKSIMAAVMPSKTKALYFVSNGNGGHKFSTNLTDHNKKVREYRKKQKSYSK